MKTGEYDPLDWTLNAATLSQFYINRDNYKSARYHLMAASHILESHFSGNEKEDYDDKKEARTKCLGQINRYCGKYGLSLLEYSHSKAIIENAEDTVVEDVAENPNDEAIENPEFDGLELGERLVEVTDKRIHDWETAKRTFLW